MKYSALTVGAALFAGVPRARAEETAADESTVAALEPSPALEIQPEVVGATDAGEPVAQTEASSKETAAEAETSVVGDVTLTRYYDVNSGYSVAVPNDWSRDQPMANTPEFHPKSEYGGRRFRIEVQPVGKVPGGGQKLTSLQNSEMENVVGAGFESPENYAAVEATKFAPVRGTPAAEVALKGGMGSAISEIVNAEVSPDGRYYYYEYRVESIYPLRFFGVAAIGPGQIGGARKLNRRDIVKVTCQVPEKDASESDYALLREIARSFKTDRVDE
jgi:hypothetical protein